MSLSKSHDMARKQTILFNICTNKSTSTSKKIHTSTSTHPHIHTSEQTDLHSNSCPSSHHFAKLCDSFPETQRKSSARRVKATWYLFFSHAMKNKMRRKFFYSLWPSPFFILLQIKTNACYSAVIKSSGSVQKSVPVPDATTPRGVLGHPEGKSHQHPPTLYVSIWILMGHLSLQKHILTHHTRRHLVY